MPAKLKDIWLNKYIDDEKKHIELRIDFDNDLHFAIPIDEPFGQAQVTEALHTAAGVVSNESDLR